MDYSTAFKSLTKGMDEFKAPVVKGLKKSSSSAESIDHCDYSTIPYNCVKAFLCKSPRVQKSRFPPIFSFESLLKSPYNFPPDTTDILSTLNYAKPMPVQTEVIPIFHEGHNMLVGSPTGSGKTAAYLLPILNFAACAKIGSNSQKKHTVHPYAIILSTTQELLGQIWTEAIRLGQNLFPKHGKIAILRRNHYGLRKKQSEEKKTISNKTRELRLPSDTKVLITTPKRLVMLLTKTGKQCPISFTSLRWLVIDECDKMLESNIGDNAAILRAFRSQLTAILHSIRVDATKFPNVALFSATLTPPVVAWATEELGRTDSSLSRGLVKVQLGDCNAAVSLVRQELRYCGSEQGKLLELRKMLIDGLIYPCLIFTESRQRATDLFREIVLCDKLILVGILSSEKSEAQRIATVKAFREGKVNVLICTDLLGRGMDFKSLMMVVNYDLPPSPVEYIHRVGRTGRAGRAGGRAVTLWTDADLPHMDSILDVMSRSGAEVDPDLRRLVAAWKARKAKQTHARALGGVVSQRKGERKLAAKVALKKSRGEFNRERGLLRPWNPHRESITDVPGSKFRDLKIANGESMVGGGRRAKKRKRAVKKTT
ncbi:putative ATP-dependent RNA helicase ddx52 [Echinococcus granulosus]|uniref:ATP-dependent RNA helicase n=1 Tax=Echinococcus granulosus TaxID=6210 RepID=A0A068WQ72_ECHGR|nr:putative ATP-dependent RNA helicase ddx52 [Echinococcus granulosus]CDS19778.1 ATP dependent RNA helicase DDX52 [Echinococcus granulosus]